MKVSMVFKLLDKQLMTRSGSCLDIYGMAELHVCPTRKGIGKMALDVAKQMADEDGKFAVVAFTEMRLVEFYKKCGWHTGSTTYLCPDDGQVKRLRSSKPLPADTIIRLTEMW